MPRRSVKTNKNLYFRSREKAGLSREKASELIGFMSDDRIERIESEKSEPHPDEILAMAECYKDPLLANMYCTGECPIGKKYVPKVNAAGLSQIVLEVIDSVNGLSASKDRLISISADGIITEDERPDLEKIVAQLDRISSAAGTLKIWMEQRLSDKGSDGE